eukprot:scaffold883_cov325-Pavlova_lutheri.AAC.10
MQPDFNVHARHPEGRARRLRERATAVGRGCVFSAKATPRGRRRGRIPTANAPDDHVHVRRGGVARGSRRAVPVVLRTLSNAPSPVGLVHLSCVQAVRAASIGQRTAIGGTFRNAMSLGSWEGGGGCLACVRIPLPAPSPTGVGTRRRPSDPPRLTPIRCTAFQGFRSDPSAAGRSIVSGAFPRWTRTCRKDLPTRGHGRAPLELPPTFLPATPSGRTIDRRGDLDEEGRDLDGNPGEILRDLRGDTFRALDRAEGGERRIGGARKRSKRKLVRSKGGSATCEGGRRRVTR